MTSGRLNDDVQSLLDWLAKAEVYLAEEQPILGDLDTVNVLIEKHKVFQQDEASHRELVVSLQDNTDLDPSIRTQLLQLSNIWERVQELGDVRENKLAEALELAEQFSDAIQVVRSWLPEAEAELKLHSIPDDEDSIMQAIENHEKFQEELRVQQTNIDKVRYMAEEILQSCHPNAVRNVKYYLTITHTRWEQVVSRARQRAVKLQDSLRLVRQNAAHVDELMDWLSDCHTLLTAKDKDSIPEDLTVVNALLNEHAEFHEELLAKTSEVEKLLRSLPMSSTTSVKGGRSPRSTPARPSTGHNDRLPASVATSAAALQRRWTTVSRMSSERNKKLIDMYNRLLEVESLKNFDFDDWRQSYVTWTRTNKLKYMDFFRRLDREGTGLVTRKQFIEAVLSSKFPTSAAELGVVFSLFDSHKLGRIYYKEFVDTVMRPDKQFTPQRPGARPVSDAERIHTEVEDQLTNCQCHSQFSAVRVDDGKYKFGDKEKVWQLKLLNGLVYVRFGASVMPLDEFLANNDPCREKPIKGSAKSGLNCRFSGSASNLALAGKSPLTTARTRGLSAEKTGRAGQRNGLVAKSWSDLSLSAVNSTPSPRDSGKVGRSASPSLAVYATLRTPRSTSSPLSVTSPASSSTPNSTPTSTSSRLYTPSLNAGLRRFAAASSSPRPDVGVMPTRYAPGKRPSATFDQRKTSTLRTDNTATGKHGAGLQSSIFQSPAHDVDF